MDNKEKSDRIVSEVLRGRSRGIDLFLPMDSYKAHGDEFSVYELWVTNSCREIIIITAGFIKPYYGIKLSDIQMWNEIEKSYKTDDFDKVLDGVHELLDLFNRVQ